MGDDRYQGKPFLRFLDCYVMDAIGALDESRAKTLTAMEPRLRQVFQTEGTWQDIVAEQMEFPADLPRTIRTIWEDGVPKMREVGMEPDPGEFTRQFVDINFSHDHRG
ncbi:MAG: hypothetical protein KDD90_02515 [Sphingomonadaceae bacterium]|jgi:hypothetical protein|nr:hypothetical protein [Sphingomonadaceae bacterium]